MKIRLLILVPVLVSIAALSANASSVKPVKGIDVIVQKTPAKAARQANPKGPAAPANGTIVRSHSNVINN